MNQFLNRVKYLILIFIIFMASCDQLPNSYESVNDYPLALDENLWIEYSSESTTFKVWSPAVDLVMVNLYETGTSEEAYDSKQLFRNDNGIWEIEISGDLKGKYYTYQVLENGKWLKETPGIYAQAVGVNGHKAMVIDLPSTNPEGWNEDKGPEIAYRNEAIIYELHIRDMTIHPESGSNFPGKYAGLVEQGTSGPNGVSTAIDHIKELGVTHVHLLPTYDHYAIDETKLDSPQFNWGYDPQNYNVPEGSFSTDPFNAEVRIKEFKQMVKNFHDNGIGVILDVVYNHTGRTEDSNFNLEAPGYYYRQWDDGRWSDASACGNETASDRPMMRKFILESVAYWAKEYHLDGFRFDLMGIHDIETMNEVADQLNAINPNIFVYGEGWTAGDSPLPIKDRALKAHTHKMPYISAFSDDLRDGLKGSVFEDSEKGFVSGKENMEESIKFGVVGSIMHPQIDYESVNYSDSAWTIEPWQAVSYVSCHDNHTIFDKLSISNSEASEEDLKSMAKLTNAIVLTSQGMAFLHAGSELLRTKKGEHNSYNLPDEINQIDWNWKVEHADVFDYYQNLISIRKAHPALRMTRAEDVRENLSFITSQNGLIVFQISNNANGDDWKNILVIYNANTEPVDVPVEGIWKVAANGGQFGKNKEVSNSVNVPRISMMMLYQE